MKTLLFLTIGLISSFSSAQVLAGEEKLLGYLPSKSGLVFQVSSGGCTAKEDFVVEVKPSDISRVVTLRLLRIRADRCFPLLPMGVQLRFSYREIGISPSDRFEIQNANGIVEGWLWPENMARPLLN